MFAPSIPAKPRPACVWRGVAYDFASGPLYAMTQGINVVVGLQDHFEWQQVAASAAGAGIGSEISDGLLGADFAKALGNGMAAKIAGSTISGIAAGLTVSALNGGRVSMMQIAVDAFGNALGSAFSDQSKRGADGQQGAKPADVSSSGSTTTGTSDSSTDSERPQWLDASEAKAKSDADAIAQRNIEQTQDWAADQINHMPIQVTAGAEGKRGAWGLAESLAGDGASNADINHVKNQLLTLNPELAKGVKMGQAYYLPSDDTPEDITLAQAADQAEATKYTPAGDPERNWLRDPQTGEPVGFVELSQRDRARSDLMAQIAAQRQNLAYDNGQSFVAGSGTPIEAKAQNPYYGTYEYQQAMSVQDAVGTLALPELAGAKLGALVGKAGRLFWAGEEIAGAAGASETVLAARARQGAMLQDNVGFNISPTAWDQYPTIGRAGTSLSDYQGVMGYFGDVAGKSEVTIPSSLASQIETDMGLVPGSLQDGFKVRQVTGIRGLEPASPLQGNSYFLGAGQHLPGGAPEMVVRSIPTVDNNFVTTLLKVKVGK